MLDIGLPGKQKISFFPNVPIIIGFPGLIDIPSTRTLPEDGLIKQEIIFIAVDLPAPLGPKNPTISPELTLKLTLSRANCSW